MMYQAFFATPPVGKITESQLKLDLRALRALLSGPEKWTQGVGARTSSGCFCLSASPNAVRWCLWGGMWKVSNKEGYRLLAFERAINLEIGEASFINWQDDEARTFDDITRVLDALIETTP